MDWIANMFFLVYFALRVSFVRTRQVAIQGTFAPGLSRSLLKTSFWRNKACIRRISLFTICDHVGRRTEKRLLATIQQISNKFSKIYVLTFLGLFAPRTRIFTKTCNWLEGKQFPPLNRLNGMQHLQDMTEFLNVFCLDRRKLRSHVDSRGVVLAIKLITWRSFRVCFPPFCAGGGVCYLRRQFGPEKSLGTKQHFLPSNDLKDVLLIPHGTHA